MTKWDWMDDALCRQVDPDLFHSVNSDAWKVQQAKSVCRKCPVIDKCMEYALENPTITGVLAATTERERSAIRRDRRRHEAQRTENLRNTSTAG